MGKSIHSRLDEIYSQPVLREKIKSSKLKFSFQYVSNPSGGTTFNCYSNAHSVSDIMQNVSAIEHYYVTTSIKLKYTNSSGTINYTQTITPQDLWGENYFDLNKTYDFPLIKQLADQGYNNFEIHFNDLNFLSGRYKSGVAASPLPSQMQMYMVQIQIIAETYYYNCYEIRE